MKTTIIIPNWNGKEYLEKLLPVLKEEKCEVIVVDNGSEDGSADYAESQEVKVIRNQENLGFSKANNQGAKLAETKYLLFLNNDTVPEKGFLRMMERWLDHNRIIGMVGAKIIFSRSGVRHVVFQGKVTHLVQVDGKLQHAGVAFNHQYLPFEIGRGADPDHADFNRAREVSAVTACCMLIRKDLFDRVGGFDEGYINGWEDNDLCLKVREEGSRIWYEPEAVIHHNHAGSEDRFKDEDKNFDFFCEKWLQSKKIMEIIGRDELKTQT